MGSRSLASISNTILAAWENWFYGPKISSTAIDPPLFILGIWRSGTTHLHNLLSQDDRFASPNTYQVFFPHTFLTTERLNSRLLSFLVPKKRPMDNMAFGFAEPQEEEFALCSITGRALPMAWAFPRQAENYGRYLTLRDTSTAETAEWKSALLALIRKLLFKHGKTLALKSPGHTCRIKLLLEMFPDARFVHIHRNPYHVFQSILNWMPKASPVWAMQRTDFKNLADSTIRQYREVYEVFFEERVLIPKDHFHELAFESLEANPVEQLRSMYESFSLPEFGHFEPALQLYLSAISGYEKNSLPELSSDLRSRVSSEWRRCFDEWGYTIQSS